MAQLTEHKEVVTTTTYNLSLTKEELKVLFYLTGYVIGDTTKSFRKVTDNIYAQIDKLNLFEHNVAHKYFKEPIIALDAN